TCVERYHDPRNTTAREGQTQSVCCRFAALGCRPNSSTMLKPRRTAATRAKTPRTYATGGGDATASGVNFQQSLGALFGLITPVSSRTNSCPEKPGAAQGRQRAWSTHLRLAHEVPRSAQ